MRSIFALLLGIALADAARVYSQESGNVNFVNRSPITGLDAPVTLQSTGEGPGPAYSAGLFVLTPDGLKLIPDSVTPFRGGPGENPAVKKYFTAKTVSIPNVKPGESVTLRIRVWQSSFGSYDKAPANRRGESADFVIPKLSGGTTLPNNFPPTLKGFVIRDR